VPYHFCRWLAGLRLAGPLLLLQQLLVLLPLPATTLLH
jgi:hypothetical protein